MELKITFLIVLYIQYESRKSTVPITTVTEEYLARVPLGMSQDYKFGHMFSNLPLCRFGTWLQKTKAYLEVQQA